MIKARSVKDLCIIGEQVLLDLFRVPEAKMFFYDKKVKKLVRFINNEGPIVCDIDKGITGSCFRNKEIISCLNSY